MKEKRSVLIVKDRIDERQQYREALEREGFLVAFVENKAKILPTLRNIAFDLLIVDMGPADAGGYDLIQSIRMEYSRLPIILVTPLYAELKRQFKILGDDIQGLFIKPASMPSIVRNVLVVLAGK